MCLENESKLVTREALEVAFNIESRELDEDP